MILRKTFRFEASHILPKHPGKCSRLHGHSWVLHVSVNGDVDPNTGFVMDYANITTAIKPLIDSRFDHYHLNDSLGIYPSSENILLWLARELSGVWEVRPEGGYLISWHTLALEETCTSYAELSRAEFITRSSHAT